MEVKSTVQRAQKRSSIAVFFVAVPLCSGVELAFGAPYGIRDTYHQLQWLVDCFRAKPFVVREPTFDEASVHLLLKLTTKASQAFTFVSTIRINQL